jgi:hypothetical protein
VARYIFWGFFFRPFDWFVFFFFMSTIRFATPFVSSETDMRRPRFFFKVPEVVELGDIHLTTCHARRLFIERPPPLLDLFIHFKTKF